MPHGHNKYKNSVSQCIYNKEFLTQSDFKRGISCDIFHYSNMDPSACVLYPRVNLTISIELRRSTQSQSTMTVINDINNGSRVFDNPNHNHIFQCENKYYDHRNTSKFITIKIFNEYY